MRDQSIDCLTDQPAWSISQSTAQPSPAPRRRERHRSSLIIHPAGNGLATACPQQPPGRKVSKTPNQRSLSAPSPLSLTTPPTPTAKGQMPRAWCDTRLTLGVDS